jgi:hypothetical protein
MTVLALGQVDEGSGVPAYLISQPDQIVSVSPVHTRLQTLPFGELSWQNFERLLFRLAGLDGHVEHCSLFGRQGQGQQGIDVYARLKSGRYICWQAKNYERFSRTNLRDAVTTFLKGKWASRTERFVLCVRAGLNDTRLQVAAEDQATRLRDKGVVFDPMDGSHLTERLREHPELVDDFFGREWVLAVLGPEAAEKLGPRLDGERAIRLRRKLAQVYDAKFRWVDPGLSVTRPGRAARDIRERFIAQDIDPSSPFSEPMLEEWSEDEASTEPLSQSDWEEDGGSLPKIREYAEASRRVESAQKVVRVPLEEWLLSCGDRELILGGAGLGKSTVLRCLALDFLTEPRVFPRVVSQLKDRIPVFVPFAFWSRLAAKEQREVSVLEVVRAIYAASLPGADLDGLLLKALDDRRLLLLVDGLDEYAEEQAARVTLMTLETFARTHEVSVIATGRPGGVQRLGTLGAWRMGRLAELSIAQQRALAECLLAETLSDQSSSLGRNDPLVQDRANEFFRDIDRTSRLRSLAGTPLLLGGLLSIAVRQAILPRTRFQLFQELVTLLLEVHPNLRATAASATTSRTGVFGRDDQRRPALSRLAFEIQRRGDDAGIGRSDARQIIEDYLSSELGPAWSREQSREGARVLTDIDSETSGLLLERGPDELAFCHAAFREHLAGLNMSVWPLEEQTAFVRDHGSDPRWRGAILSVLQSMPRHGEVQELLRQISDAGSRGSSESSRRILLADAVFALAGAAGAVGRDIAVRTLDRVEDANNDAERVELLNLCLDGPRDGPIGAAISARVGRWWPCVSRWRADAYIAVSAWPRSQDTYRGLWLGLFDEEIDNRIAAAHGIATYASGDEAVLGDLLSLIRDVDSPEVVATALEAVARGWIDHPSVEDYLSSAMSSAEISIRGVTALALFRKGIRTDQIKTALVDLIDGRRPWTARAFTVRAVDALAKGWASDPELQELYWSSIGLVGAGHRPLQYDVAPTLALKCAGADDRVVPWLVSVFQDDKRGRLSLNPDDYLEGITPLVLGNAAVRSAVDVWLADVEGRRFDYAAVRLAVLLQTDNAKRYLIEEFKRPGSRGYHIAPALLNGWGMSDPEVAELLGRAAQADPVERQDIAYEIPRIIEDPQLALGSLREILDLPIVERPDFLVDGFSQLRPLRNEEEIVKELLRHISVTGDRRSGLNGIIEHFPQQPTVRDLACRALSERDAPLATIARAYRDDSGLRSEILNRLNTLPVRFRRIIAARASGRSSDPVLRRVLDLFDSEVDEGAKVLAAIGYGKAKASDGTDVESVTADLAKQLHAVGHDLEERRVAAFAALLTLGRLDLVASAVEPPGDKPVTIGIFEGLHKAGPALELVAEHWEQIEKVFGSTIPARLSRWATADSVDWAALAPYITRSRRLTEAFLDRCADERWSMAAACLEALKRIQPASSLLFVACKRALLGAENEHQLNPFERKSARITAARIIGLDFTNDEESREVLIQATEDRWQGVGAVGLTGVSPTLGRLKSMCQELRESGRGLFSWPVTTAVAAAAADAELFAKVTGSFITRKWLSIWDFAGVTLDILRSRLDRDPSARQELLKAASERIDSPGMLVSVACLLGTSAANDAEVLARLQNLADQEATRIGTPRFGLDVTTNRSRAVAPTLQELLKTHQTEPRSAI